MSFYCILGKVDRLRRVNHELLELINERSGTLERALKGYVNVEDSIPLRSNDSGGSPSDECSLQDVDLVARETSLTGTQSATSRVSSVDPALVSLQQYHVSNDNGHLNHEKTSVTSRIRQDIFGKKVKKSMMTFHSEKDADEKGAVYYDNPSLEAGVSSIRDSALPPEASPPSNFQQGRTVHTSASSASLLDLENQTEARNHAAASGTTEHTALTMVVTHHVKWEKTLEFENWTKDMFKKM